MLRVAVLVSGGGTNLQAMIDALVEGKITNTEIVAVISNNQNAYALQRAEKNGIENCCIDPKSYEDRELFSQTMIETLNTLKVDLVVLAGYLVVLEESFIKAFRNRIVNIHPSLIPSFCGDGFYGNVVHRAVKSRGCTVSGCTVHFADDKYDEGPIILQRCVEIAYDDDIAAIASNVFSAECEAFPEAINRVDGKGVDFFWKRVCS